MTSFWDKAAIRITALAVVMMLLCAPVAAMPADGGGDEFGIATAWQVVVDGWNSVLEAVGVDVDEQDPTSPTTTTTTDTTTSPEPDNGSGESHGIPDPDG